MTITDYKILFSYEGTQKLEGLVKNAISDGWQPIGGIVVHQMKTVSEDIATIYYIQTVVKYKKTQ